MKALHSLYIMVFEKAHEVYQKRLILKIITEFWNQLKFLCIDFRGPEFLVSIVDFVSKTVVKDKEVVSKKALFTCTKMFYTMQKR